MKYNYSILFLKSVSFHINPSSHICDFNVRTFEKCLYHCQFSSPVQILTHTRHFHITVAHCNHYDTLKISKDSTHKEIKSAYILMAKKFHPDVNPGNPNAEKIFKEIATAYEILGNEITKKQYDNEMILSEFNIQKSRSKQTQNMSEEEERLRKKYPGYYARKDREAAEEERLRKKYPEYYARKEREAANDEFNPFSTRNHGRKNKKDENVNVVLSILNIQYLIFIGVIWKAMYNRFKAESGKKDG